MSAPTPLGASSEGAEYAALLARHGAGLAKLIVVAVTTSGLWYAMDARVGRVEEAQQRESSAAREERVKVREEIRELHRAREAHAIAQTAMREQLTAVAEMLREVKESTTIIRDRLGDPSAQRRGSAAAGNP